MTFPMRMAGWWRVPRESSSVVETVNRKLLDAFEDDHVPVTGFVIQKTVESLGPALGPDILKAWTSRGLTSEITLTPTPISMDSR